MRDREQQPDGNLYSDYCMVCAVLHAKGKCVLTLGDRLKAARERRGWTQTELANALGLSSTYVRRVEQEDILPRQSMLKRIAEVLSADVDLLEALLAAHREVLCRRNLDLDGAVERP